MKRFLIAVGLSIFLHGLILSMGQRCVKKKPIDRLQPHPIVFVLSYHEPQVKSLRLEKTPENAQRVITPNTIKEKKEQVKTKPFERIEREVQTKTKSKSFKEIKPSTEITKSQQFKPEKEIHTKINHDEIIFLKHELPYEHQETETYKILPEIYMVSDEKDKLRIALPAREDTTSGPPVQNIQVAIPIYRNNPPPKYPILARQRGLQGTVILEVLVNHEGKVEMTKLIHSSTHDVLDSAAMASVENWLFRPGRSDNEKVSMWVKVPIKYQLK